MQCLFKWEELDGMVQVVGMNNEEFSVKLRQSHIGDVTPKLGYVGRCDYQYSETPLM